MGFIHYELLAREVLFPGKDHVDMLRRIAATLGFSMEHDVTWVCEKDMAQAKEPQVRGNVYRHASK